MYYTLHPHCLSQSHNEPSELDMVIIPFRQIRTLSQRSEMR